MEEDKFRKIAKEEITKAIMQNIDSTLIFSYIQALEKENKALKEILKERFGYLYE